MHKKRILILGATGILVNGKVNLVPYKKIEVFVL